MQKRDIRGTCRRIRDAIPRDERERLDGAISRHLFGWDAFEEAEGVFCYVSFGSEVSTSAILSEALARGKVLAAPRVDPTAKVMGAFVVEDLERDLGPGFYGILEPLPHCPEAHSLDLVVAPGLAFTRRGDRLGYGGGFYDRFLKAHGGIVSCALVHGALLVDRLPVKEHDQAVDYLITESGVFKTERVGHG